MGNFTFTPNRQMNEVIREAVAQGWRFGKARNNHVKMMTPDGRVVFGPSTPSDHRAILNFKAKLKRTWSGATK